MVVHSAHTIHTVYVLSRLSLKTLTRHGHALAHLTQLSGSQASGDRPQLTAGEPAGNCHVDKDYYLELSRASRGELCDSYRAAPSATASVIAHFKIETLAANTVHSYTFLVCRIRSRILLTHLTVIVKSKRCPGRPWPWRLRGEVHARFHLFPFSELG